MYTLPLKRDSRQQKLNPLRVHSVFATRQQRFYLTSMDNPPTLSCCHLLPAGATSTRPADSTSGMTMGCKHTFSSQSCLSSFWTECKIQSLSVTEFLQSRLWQRNLNSNNLIKPFLKNVISLLSWCLSVLIVTGVLPSKHRTEWEWIFIWTSFNNFFFLILTLF